MGKFFKVFLFFITIIGIFKFFPKEEKKISKLKIAAAKDISGELLYEIGKNMQLEKRELSDTLIGDC